jgi:predicted Zn-dependent protease
MREPGIVWLAASLLCLHFTAVEAAAAPRSDATAKARTRAEIAKLPIAPETRAELIVQSDPKDVQSRLDAAQAYLHAARDTPQNLAAAERHLSELLKLAPNNFDALLLVGDVAMRRNQPLLAVSHYQDAARIKPEHAGTQLRLGEALRRAGDIKGSDTAFDAYRRLNHLPPLTRTKSATSK